MITLAVHRRFLPPLPSIEEVRATPPLPEDTVHGLPFIEKSYDIRKTGFGVSESVEGDPHVMI